LKDGSELKYQVNRTINKTDFTGPILRRIFGPKRENQIWRVKTNEELDKLIKLKI
jgi:hypothetical protein